MTLELTEDQHLQLCNLVSRGMKLSDAKAKILGKAKAKPKPKKAKNPVDPEPKTDGVVLEQTEPEVSEPETGEDATPWAE